MKKIWRTIIVVLNLLILITNMAFAFSYNEVEINDLIEPASDWAKLEIDKAKEAGLLTPNTSLFFKNNITRSQFAELVVNMVEKVTDNEITPASTFTFTDTSDTNILKAYSAGIVNGVTTTEFSPDALITREQIATMIYRAITYVEKEKNAEYTVKNDSLKNYTDNADVSSYALQGVGILANNNIMTGTSATTLSPKSSATIEQSILLIYRLFTSVSN